MSVLAQHPKPSSEASPRELEDAIRVVSRAAARRDLNDPMHALVYGGLVAFTESQCIQALLDLVNQPSLEELPGPMIEYNELRNRLNVDQKNYSARAVLPVQMKHQYAGLLDEVIRDPIAAD